MFVSLLIAAALCVLAWVYVRWTRVRQYWAKRGVPHLPPHPVMGSLTFLQRQNPGRWMINTYQHFKTPYVGAWWFWRPTLIINSPEIARNVLVKDFANFRDRLLGSGSSDPIGHLNIFTVNEPLWSSIRRRLTSLFTACKLRALQNLLDTKANQLIERIKSTENKSAISLRILFTDYTSDVIGTAAFGVETKAIIGGDCPMRKVTKAFMTFDLYRGICWSSIFFFPELVNVFRFTFFPKWATDYFTKVFRMVSKQRKDEQNRIVEPKDLVDALIKLKQESDEKNEGLTEDIIVAQAAIFLLGGFETSGSALSFALYELAFKPEIQEKMYNELIQIKEQHENCSRLDISKLAEAPYVNSVIKEALRKYSPMGWLDRIAVNDYKIDDNLTIEAGTPIYVNAIGMQYDENYFPNPLDFDPERFMPENEKNIKPFTYLPFGEGPRNCIGKRFGQISVRNALSHVILNYKVAPVANQPKPNDIEFEKHGLFLVPGQDLFVDFIPRN